MGYRRTVQGERGRITELYAAEQRRLDDGYDHLGDDVVVTQSARSPRLVARARLAPRKTSRPRLPGEVRAVRTKAPARKLVVPGPATDWRSRVISGAPLVEGVEDPELPEDQLPAPKMPGAPARGHDLPAAPPPLPEPGPVLTAEPMGPPAKQNGGMPWGLLAAAGIAGAAIWYFTRKGR